MSEAGLHSTSPPATTPSLSELPILLKRKRRTSETPVDTEASVHAADSRQGGNTKPKTEYPAGRVVNGYNFARDDSVHSARPPKNGSCYICTSPNHLMRDCPHFGRWEAMRMANLLDHVLDITQERMDEEEAYYIVYLAETSSSSAYSLCDLEATVLAVKSDDASERTVSVEEGSLSTGPNRNERRRARFTRTPGWMTKGKERKTEESRNHAPRRQRRSAERRVAFATDNSGPTVRAATLKRRLPVGFGATDARALNALVHVGSLDAEPVKGQVDSGATFP
uniref:CCHC-type domain-containing protein n=1 Tax=Mycena chlorophos TaxID=658473 RepID=A0ABQ0KUS2_MYCCL|nr:predicted protein [Mycena chlorophos]